MSLNEELISADEVALYDRQIRLWGLDAQNRMRLASVLIVGFSAIGAEVAKNIVLSGIGSLTVYDTQIITPQDLGANFFFSESLLSQNRAEAAINPLQELNERVIVKAISEEVKEEEFNNFFTGYDIVVACDKKYKELVKINNACRSNSSKFTKFYAASSYGLYGYVFADLIQHEFIIEREKSNVCAKVGAETKSRSIISVSYSDKQPKIKEIITKQEIYKPINDLVKDSIGFGKDLRARQKVRVSPILPLVLASWQDKTTKEEIYEVIRSLELPVNIVSDSLMNDFMKCRGAEISPVAAILGGVIAQNLLNTLSKKEQPLQNLLVLDCDSMTAPVYLV